MSKISLLFKGLLFFLTALCFMPQNANGQNEASLFVSKWLNYTDCENALYHYYNSLAGKQIDHRTRRVDQITTREQWQQRQVEIRHTLMGSVGPFPEKTTLKPVVTGVIQKADYRAEKIIFQSMPKIYVTACLFIPKNRLSKSPAIIYCSGHSIESFRGEAYQRSILNLVKKGFIVLAFDPIGQGERLQYYDPETKSSRIGGPTLEHSYPGAQCFITGSSLAKFMIWDGIRAVDYLLTRKEVDPKRIGITGRSGGGTQSAYIAAFDERIHAVAPECYLTSFKRLLESPRGPQDAEQNFYHGIASGIDHADLLQVRAPKPALMIVTTRDIFSIQGAYETAEEVLQTYQSFGREDCFSIAEDDAAHESTLKNREAMYAFFQKHLNLPGNAGDENVVFLTPTELQVTPTGQIVTDFQAETVNSINRANAEKLIERLQNKRNDYPTGLESVIENAKKIAGYETANINFDVTFMGRYHEKGYAVEWFFIKDERNILLPFQVMVPTQAGKHPAILYLQPNGKDTEAARKTADTLARQGYLTIIPDLLGFGEMGPGIFTGDAYKFKIGIGAYNIWFFGVQVAKSLVAIHAEQINQMIKYIQTRPDVLTDRLFAMAEENLCPALLHAAAFDGQLSGVAFFRPLISFETIVMNEYYAPELIHATVPGALLEYDLVDLACALAPRKVCFANVIDHNREVMPLSDAAEALTTLTTVYQKRNAPSHLAIVADENATAMNDFFPELIARGFLPVR